MARIRSIKPEVRISEKVNSWPIECRYFWVLLWGYCDDYGIGRDNARLIVADSFPLDDHITADMVSAWMHILWDSGVIERYLVGDAAYFRVVNWDEHQKISHPAKQFLPDISEATYVIPRVAETLRSVTETFEKTSPKQGAGSSEQGAGSSEQGVAPKEPKLNLPAMFDSAYELWPKKTKREEALARFVAAAKKRDPFLLVDDIQKFGKAYALSTDKNFVPALGAWIYQQRWTDELPTPAARQGMTRGEENMAVVARYAQMAEREAIGS